MTEEEQRIIREHELLRKLTEVLRRWRSDYFPITASERDNATSTAVFHNLDPLKQLLFDALIEQQPAPAPAAPETPAKNRGGRPRINSWDNFWIEVVLIAHQDGLPERENVMQQMLDITSQWTPQPSPDQMRDRLSALYEALRRER
jgi:hypothetical protein